MNYYKHVISRCCCVFLACFFLTESFSQKVGIVLSGGGVSGITHVGVLKALEENNIPIDYIAGTSAGALVAGLYASGFSPEEMEALFTSEKYIKMVQGKLEKEFIYYFKKNDPDASWVSFKLAKNKSIIDALPTNLVSPVELDYEMMVQLSGASAVSNYNFDSLFIPFRCIASDVAAKEQVVFKNGHLNQAIRASMSYPFYLRPIKVNGKLLFDGGMYNNFPSDIMYEDFFPDIIIGSNVAQNMPPPNEDDLISQLKSMLVSKTNYSVLCENGIIIEPNDEGIGLFDFSRTSEAIQRGYIAANERMEEIKQIISRRNERANVVLRRDSFKRKQPTVLIKDIFITGLNKGQQEYVKKSLRSHNRLISTNDLKKKYFQVFSDEKIKYIYPTAVYNKQNNLYDLNLDIKPERNIAIEVGGNFSSRPINTGYFGAKYNYFGRIGFTAMGNSYFGKLYSSAQAKLRIDFPISIPFFIEPEYTLNQWDYFKSRATFFEDVQASYLVQNGNFGGLMLGLPIGYNGKSSLGFNFGELTDNYYQTKSFSKSDTTDKTVFRFTSPYINYEINTLNYKQYANSGARFLFSYRFVTGQETTLPGSTSNDISKYYFGHDWHQFKLQYNNYYKQKGKIRLGLYIEAVYSTQEFFNNYTASILRSPSFQPTPESKTLFLESFRAHKYVAGGQKVIFSVMENLDIRIEGYVFQPYQRLIKTEKNTVELGKPFDKRYTILMGAVVYNTPIGPISLSTNYYHNLPEVALTNKTPLTFMFHFGYIIFNKKALE